MESGIIASHINIYVDINQLDFELESEQSQVVLNLMNQIKRANLEYNQIQQKIQQLEEEDSRIAAPHHRTPRRLENEKNRYKDLQEILFSIKDDLVNNYHNTIKWPKYSFNVSKFWNDLNRSNLFDELEKLQLASVAIKYKELMKNSRVYSYTYLSSTQSTIKLPIPTDSLSEFVGLLTDNLIKHFNIITEDTIERDFKNLHKLTFNRVPFTILNRPEVIFYFSDYGTIVFNPTNYDRVVFGNRHVGSRDFSAVVSLLALDDEDTRAHHAQRVALVEERPDYIKAFLLNNWKSNTENENNDSEENYFIINRTFVNNDKSSNHKIITWNILLPIESIIDSSEYQNSFISYLITNGFHVPYKEKRRMSFYLSNITNPEVIQLFEDVTQDNLPESDYSMPEFMSEGPLVGEIMSLKVPNKYRTADDISYWNVQIIGYSDPERSYYMNSDNELTARYKVRAEAGDNKKIEYVLEEKELVTSINTRTASSPPDFNATSTSDAPPDAPSTPNAPSTPAQLKKKIAESPELNSDPSFIKQMDEVSNKFQNIKSPLANPILLRQADDLLSQRKNLKKIEKVFEFAERCPTELTETMINQDVNGHKVFMKTQIDYSRGDGKHGKTIQVIFEKNNNNSEWLTLKTYLYRLLVIDTLHDFYETAQMEKGKRLELMNIPENNNKFLDFYRQYLNEIVDFFPDLNKYDIGDKRNFYHGDNIKKDKHYTIRDIAKMDNGELKVFLTLIKNTGYTSVLEAELKKEGKNKYEYGEIIAIREKYQEIMDRPYYAKPIIVDADKSSSQFFDIMREYYNQQKNQNNRAGYDTPGPLLYLKTLSHELDQATTPKLERMLKSLADIHDRFYSVTRLNCLKKQNDKSCIKALRELEPTKLKNPEDEEEKQAKEAQKEARQAVSRMQLDDSSDDLSDSQEIIYEKGYVVTVEMIKRDLGDEDTFLAYELDTSFIGNESELDDKEKSEFLLGLIHHFSVNKLNITLRDVVDEALPKPGSSNDNAFEETSRRTNTRRKKTEDSRPTHTWWSKRILLKSVIKQNNSNPNVGKSVAAFILECMKFIYEIIPELNLSNSDDILHPIKMIQSIIKLMWIPQNNNNFNKWKQNILIRVKKYLKVWREDYDKKHLGMFYRLLNAIEIFELSSITKQYSIELLSSILIKIVGNSNGSADWEGLYRQYTDEQKIFIDNNNNNNIVWANTRTSKPLSKTNLDVRLKKIFNTEYNGDDAWFSTMLSHINQKKTQSNEDDDGSGSFGVGKLCDWMFNHEVANTTPYDHIVKPVILKMIMDSFHYINLLENKLQVERKQLWSMTIKKPLLPIMCTFDMNCAYLCSFFSNQIQPFIEMNKKARPPTRPLTIVNKTELTQWKRKINEWELEQDEQQQGSDNYVPQTAGRSLTKHILDTSNKNEIIKTRRRGDKIKSNGKITRRKSI